MGLLFYEFKEKSNRKYIFIIYFLMLSVLVLYHISQYNSDSGLYLQGFQGMQKSALVFFACMTFVAFEIFCDFQKREWKELLLLNRGGLLKTVWTKDILLILLIVLGFAVVSIIEFAKLLRADMNSYPFVFENICRVLILNYLLLPIVGALTGKTAALLSRKRWSGYIWILLILLFTCGLFERINTALYMTVGVNLDKIFRFLQFEQPNSRWVVDYLYLIPAENYRFCLFGTWIAGLGILICMACLKRKAMRVIAMSVCAAFCIIFGAQTADCGNCVNYNLNADNAANKQTEFADDLPAGEVKADFTVEKCRLDLNITDELEAEAILILGPENLDIYRFTLYRGYDITEITDENGNALDYDRQEDYVAVHVSGDIAEIHLSYHGYQQSFYSNQFGLMLPGYFAYYPQPGFRRVFLNQEVQTYVYYGFNTEEELLQETDYEITVRYDKPVFSNLKKDHGVFYGKTIAPTIMGGAAAEEYWDDGHFIYPETVDLSGISMSELIESLTGYCDILGLPSEQFAGLEHIIVVPASVYVGDSWGKNRIVGECLFLGTDWVAGADIDVDELAEEIIKQYMNVQGEKDVLLNVLFAVMDDAIYLEDLKPMDEEQFFSVAYDADDPMSEKYTEMIFDSEQDRMFLTLIGKYGREDIFRKTAEYLMNPDVTENSAEFMQRLYLELEE